MKSFSEIRLECLRLSSMLATGKNIAPKEVVPQAMEYYRWVTQAEDEKAEPADVARLADRFGHR